MTDTTKPLSAEERLRLARHLVDEQARDPALWFEAEYITEAILQDALRELHAIIEGKWPFECALDLLAKLDEFAALSQHKEGEG